MAIEFECPSCSETIRVPDAYSGRQGKCPSCNQRLLVPTIPVPDDLPGKGTQLTLPQESTGSVPGASIAAVVPQKAGFVARPRRSRRRPARALVIGIPVIGFLLLLGIIAFSISGNLPDLHGQLSATLLTNRSLPRTVIPWADTGLNADDRELLQTALRDSPERLSSEQMSCQLIGADEGLEVLVTVPSGSAWCVVETATDNNKSLQLWRKRERVRLNAERRAVFLKALKSWCNDKLRQIRGEKVLLDGVTVRDQVALASRLDAFGFAVEGRGDNRVFRPALESDGGLLYFSVPENTVRFSIQGRKSANGQAWFHGEYQVNVTAGQDASPAETGDAPPGDEANDMTPDAGANGQKSPEPDAPTEPTGGKPEADAMEPAMNNSAGGMRTE